MPYWYIATALKGKNSESTRGAIKQALITTGKDSNGEVFPVNDEAEKFKLGNLDSLMSINDQLLKLDSQMEGILKKIEKQYIDIKETDKAKFNVIVSDTNYEIDSYITKKFEWNDKVYARNQKLQVIISMLQSRMNKAEGELRKHTLNFQDCKTQSASLAKKEGNLLVRDLADVLNEDAVGQKDFIHHNHIATVVVIVQKDQVKQFLGAYEQYKNVIPGSAKEFKKIQDENYSLFRVCLLTVNYDKSKVDEKWNVCSDFSRFGRDNLKVTVREFHFDPQAYREREKKRIELNSNLGRLQNTLVKACETHFSELYQNYIHMKRVRLLVDLTMRFGPKEVGRETFCTCLVKVSNSSKEKGVQNSLTDLFADAQNKDMYGTKEELEDSEDFFPFVYIPVHTF